MTKTWIMADVVPEGNKDYITEGHWYQIALEKHGKFGTTVWDSGRVGYTGLKGSAHLDDGDWNVYTGDSPPTTKTPLQDQAVGLCTQFFENYDEHEAIDQGTLVHQAWKVGEELSKLDKGE